MNVDDVIARHASRLEEHKRFLQHSGGASTSQDSASPAAREAAMRRALFPADCPTPSPNPFSPFVDGDLYAMPSPPRRHDDPNGPDSSNVQNKVKTKPPGKNKNSKNSSMNNSKSYHNYSNNNNNNNNRHSSSGGDGVLSAYGRIGLRERLAAEDRAVDAQLLAAGRYHAALDPDGMYAKSQLWLEGRERSRRALADERARSVRDECPFRPGRPGREGRAEGREGRALRALRALRARSAAAAGAAAAARLRRDPSVVAHLGRLEEARQQRAEAERRVSGASGRRWKNEQTIPREFVFSRKVASIPALRKPLSAPMGRRAREAAEEFGAMQSAPHVLEERSVASSTQVPSTNEGLEGGAGVQSGIAGMREKLREFAEREKCQQEIITQLQEEITEKDRELEKQRGEMKLLQRELEAAKSTVRRLTLQDAPQLEKEVTLVEMT